MVLFSIGKKFRHPMLSSPVEHFYHLCRHQTLTDNEETGKRSRHQKRSESGETCISDDLCQYKMMLAGAEMWFSCYVNLCHEEMMDGKSKKALYLTTFEWVNLLLPVSGETVSMVWRLFQANTKISCRYVSTFRSHAALGMVHES